MRVTAIGVRVLGCHVLRECVGKLCGSPRRWGGGEDSGRGHAYGADVVREERDDLCSNELERRGFESDQSAVANQRVGIRELAESDTDSSFIQLTAEERKRRSADDARDAGVR